jgi:hypothetical protein
VSDASGPIGYQSVLSEPLDGHVTSTVTFTLKISAAAPDLQETLQGKLFGSNYATGLVDGPTLTVDASADAVVSVKVTDARSAQWAFRLCCERRQQLPWRASQCEDHYHVAGRPECQGQRIVLTEHREGRLHGGQGAEGAAPRLISTSGSAC